MLLAAFRPSLRFLYGTSGLQLHTVISVLTSSATVVPHLKRYQPLSLCLLYMESVAMYSQFESRLL